MTRRKKSEAERVFPERVTKPELPRTEPIRSWSTLFGPNGQSGVTSAFGANGFGDLAGDSVGRGVELGYRVIDDYMKQGASAAGAFSGAPTGTPPSRDDLPRMTERMLQYTSDFTSLWFDAMRIMTGQVNGQPSGDKAAPRPTAGEPAESAARSRFVLDVKSARAVEIIVTLDEPVKGGLAVEPLRASTGKAAITGVTIEPPTGAGGQLRVKVHVPPTLRRGRYTGSVLEASTRRARGRVTVVVGA